MIASDDTTPFLLVQYILVFYSTFFLFSDHFPLPFFSISRTPGVTIPSPAPSDRTLPSWCVRLQRLLDLSMETYGEMDALYDLAFSFIECGKMRQAKKVLDTPGLRSVMAETRRGELLEDLPGSVRMPGRVFARNIITVLRDTDKL